MDQASEAASQDKPGAGCPFLAGQAAAASKTGDIPHFPLPRDNPIDPPPHYAGLREANALGKVRLWDGNDAWLITRYEDFRSVLGDPRFSADITRQGYPTVNAGMKVARGNYRSFITMDAPQHTAHRRMLTGEFAIKRMEAFRPKIQRIVDGLIDDMLARGGPLDIVSDLALPIPSLAICELLGVPYEDHDFFQSRARVLASHTTTTEQALAASHELCEIYLRQLIRKKDADPQDDILSRLVVNHVRKGDLTENELISMARLLLIAGHETTANMTSMGVFLFLQHPEQWAELQANPVLVPQAVEEVLRYVDVTHSGRRRVALEDVHVGGQLIRAGEGIIALSVSANRDDAAFPEAHRFDIRREARHQVAFGYGVHQCLGQPLARMELQVVFATLARRMPTLRLAAPAESLKFKDEMFIYGIKCLPVAW
jgi:cytochrome P450